MKFLLGFSLIVSFFMSTFSLIASDTGKKAAAAAAPSASANVGQQSAQQTQEDFCKGINNATVTGEQGSAGADETTGKNAAPR